jgi:SNF2 family DNA or RNA helicase
MGRMYGAIAKKGAFWWISAEPHVAMKLRRLFDGSARGEKNEVILKASDATAHELVWFMTRHPFEVGDGVDIAAAAGRHQAILDSIDATRRPEYVPPAFDLAVPARDYQAVGADQIVRSGGCLIADDLGLGKTVTLICVMLAEGALPAVVVTLTHLCKQWKEMLARFAPKLRVHVINRGTPYDFNDTIYSELAASGRRRIVKNGIKLPPDVVILNYHKLHGWADSLVGFGPKYLAFDEIQELRKGDASKKGEAATALSRSVRYRSGASATPIYNYGAEIWHIIEVLRPGLLGSYEEFCREWCTGSERKKVVKDPAALRAFLLESGAMLRRTRRDVGRELPPMQRIWVDIETDPAKLKDVSESVAELARVVLRTNIDPFAKMKAAGELDWKLRQATGLAKVRGVVDFVTMAIEGGTSRVLLYGHHHLVFDAWEEGLATNGIKVSRYTGRESDTQKSRSVKAFEAGDTPVLMMANRAGAGVDGLQFICSTSIVGELDWSPGVHIQGEGRLDRDGQVDPVTAFYLTAEDGSDPVIQEVLGLKNTQRAGIVDGALGASSQAEEVDMSRMQRLAEAYLKTRGLL